jgi:hypothetical protein
MKLRTIALVSSLLSLTACQSHHAAIELICNAPTQCAECNVADPSARAMHLAEYISNHLTNSEAVAMVSSMANMEPSSRAQVLRSEAAREGIASCPMADSVDTASAPH